MARFSNVGRQNAEFATRFLNDEGITIVNASTGGNLGRKLEYWPVSGRARQHALDSQQTERTVERERPRPIVAPTAETVEFF
jgi:chemotaxis protein CheD